MAKTIRQVSELPRWFHLNKYEGAKKLDEIGWYIQLKTRAFFMLYVNTWGDCTEKEKNFKDVINLIREAPIIDLTSDPRLSSFIDNSINELKLKSPNYTLGVRSLTFYELLQISYQFGIERLEYLQNYINQLITRDSNKSFTIPLWAHEPLDAGREIENYPLSLNLTLPDSILIEQFKQYLPKLRLKTGTEEWAKQFKRNNFSDWVRFGVLPCIDLKIWAKEEKINIPNRVTANAIFSDGEGGEEVVRKTVNPLVDWLLTFDCHSTLTAKAAIKIAE